VEATLAPTGALDTEFLDPGLERDCTVNRTCYIEQGGESRRKRTIQVRIFRGEQQYVAECLDLLVVTEASTLDD